MNNITITIEFTLQEFSGTDDISALRAWTDGNSMPLTLPAKKLLWELAERFRIVEGNQKFLHIESVRLA